MQKTLIGALVVLILLVSKCVPQNSDEQDIDRLFADLKQTLVKRATPDALLSPTLSAAQRQDEVKKATRPYVTIDFKYNLADLQRTSPTRAKLPLIMEWETARQTGRIQDTAQLEKVDGRWYFSDFDFMAFPWVLVVVGCSLAVGFASLVICFYRRNKKRSPVPV